MCPHRKRQQRFTPMTHDLPVPTLVYLSGSLRGKTLRLSGDRIQIGGGASADLPLPGGRAVDPERHYATLVRTGRTYRLEVEPGCRVWVNGEPADALALASGDLLEVGRGGAVLRFRLYPPEEAGAKTLQEIFSDCLDCARYSGRGPLGQASVFLGQVPGALASQTTRTFRIGMVAALVLVGLLTVSALRKGSQLEDRIELQTASLGQMRELLETSRRETVTPEDLSMFLGEVPEEGMTAEAVRQLRAELERTNERVGALEGRAGASARVAAIASEATVLVLGSYGFSHPRDGRPLRFRAGAGGRPLTGMDGQPMVTFDENAGPVVQMHYTGTAFLVSDDGLMVTNRHVAVPWEYEPLARRLAEGGLVPTRGRYAAYLPGRAQPIPLTVVASGEDVRSPDVALVRLAEVPAGIAHLTLREEPAVAGEEVFLVGYPLGIRAIVARSGIEFMESLRERGGGGMWEVAQELADRGLVTPLVTRGIVGQVNVENITYDAQTAGGGSGGPVLDQEGRVLAVNMAVLPDFAGSNLGVPTARMLTLMESARVRPGR
ncbi:MAG: trypsin-like peptidase domain-containing protein [Longimicrobiales bacterium]|nr:trypsin-like peptidase domain-containing protein [Longimicrobiales bacterium]